MGNRTHKSDSLSNLNEDSTYNAANMQLSRGGVTYTPDMNGNTLTDGTRTNTWNVQNQLTHCLSQNQNTDFVYGEDGIRRKKTTWTGSDVAHAVTTDYVLDNGTLVQERNHANGAAVDYLVGARGAEARWDETSGQVRWYLYDGLGSVVGEVAAGTPNQDLTVQSKRTYDVFGAIRGGVNPAGNSSQKFVGSLGHQTDAESGGLVYMRARYMDPTTGRFVSEDPAKDGMNWFVYCSNNPINLQDSDGKKGELLAQIINALTVPLLIGIIATMMIGYGSRENVASDFLVGFGCLLLVFDAFYTIQCLKPIMEGIGNRYKNKIEREEQESDAVNGLKTMGGLQCAITGWSLEQQFALFEMGAE